MLEELAATADDARSVVGRAEGLLREIADHLAALREGTHVSDPVVGRVDACSAKSSDKGTIRNLSGAIMAKFTAKLARTA
jgi:hypothetical protein